MTKSVLTNEQVKREWPIVHDRVVHKSIGYQAYAEIGSRSYTLTKVSNSDVVAISD